MSTTAATTRTRTCSCGAPSSAGTWLCTPCQAQLAEDYVTAASIIASHDAPTTTTVTSAPFDCATVDHLADLLWRWDLDVHLTRPAVMSPGGLAAVRRNRLRAVMRDMRSPELARALREALASAECVIAVCAKAGGHH